MLVASSLHFPANKTPANQKSFLRLVYTAASQREYALLCPSAILQELPFMLQVLKTG